MKLMDMICPQFRKLNEKQDYSNKSFHFMSFSDVIKVVDTILINLQ